jgi:hypothetical protein
VGDHTLLVGSPIEASHDADAHPLVLHRPATVHTSSTHTYDAPEKPVRDGAHAVP